MEKDILEDGALLEHTLETGACIVLRKASRAVTRRFDALLDTSGLRSTQVVVLLELAHHGTMTLSQLSENLVMEKSSTSRMMRTLADRGLLSVSYSGSKGYASCRLTRTGREALRAAYPHWQKGQEEFLAALGQRDGDEAWARIRAALKDVVRIMSATH